MMGGRRDGGCWRKVQRTRRFSPAAKTRIRDSTEKWLSTTRVENRLNILSLSLSNPPHTASAEQQQQNSPAFAMYFIFCLTGCCAVNPKRRRVWKKKTFRSRFTVLFAFSMKSILAHCTSRFYGRIENVFFLLLLCDLLSPRT